MLEISSATSVSAKKLSKSVHGQQSYCKLMHPRLSNLSDWVIVRVTEWPCSPGHTCSVIRFMCFCVAIFTMCENK